MRGHTFSAKCSQMRTHVLACTYTNMHMPKSRKIRKKAPFLTPQIKKEKSKNRKNRYLCFRIWYLCFRILDEAKRDLGKFGGHKVTSSGQVCQGWWLGGFINYKIFALGKLKPKYAIHNNWNADNVFKQATIICLMWCCGKWSTFLAQAICSRLLMGNVIVHCASHHNIYI